MKAKGRKSQSAAKRVGRHCPRLCEESALSVEMWPQALPAPNNVDTTLNGDELQSLIDEMRVQDFDSIRFATYRSACKLRFIQKKTNVHLVGIWDMIEAFRENALNSMPITATLKISRLELLLTSIFHNLNKRLPTSQHVDTDKSISALLSFMLGTYDRQHANRLTVFATKIGLATLCAGKLVDKLRYVFSQISDSTGRMEYEKFSEYLQQVLALPTAVFEAPTFGFSETALQQCFKPTDNVTLNMFLDTIMGDVCPPCLMWLPLLHRMTAVETVYHPVVCDACQVRSFTGFRYKCQRCPNYQLCQSCFWRGRTSQSHSSEHEMKEYSSYKSPTKQIAHSIHKSLQCMPLISQKVERNFDAKPQRCIDLSNIVQIGNPSYRYHQGEPFTDASTLALPGQYGNMHAMDDEHKLIARYAAKLAGRTIHTPSLGKDKRTLSKPDMISERAVISQLEEENNEMLKEVASMEQQLGDGVIPVGGMRDRTVELEAKMKEKQQIRRQLMQQLERLMTQLNGPNMTMTRKPVNLGDLPPELEGVGSMVTAAFRQTDADLNKFPEITQLQGDLLLAADAITSNMTDLVQELDQASEETPNENGNA